jgi:hypothetical protein
MVRFPCRSFVACFRVEAGEETIARRASLCRFLFGLLIAWRSLSIFGFSIVHFDAGYIREWAFAETLLGIAIASGFFTQISLVVLIAAFFGNPPYAATLGDQAALLLSLGLILSGSHRKYSLDFLLRSRFPGRAAGLFFDPIRLELSPGHFACVRLILIALFWSVCLSAMSFHFLDSLWLQGEVLQLLFTMPYMSPLHFFFSSLRDAAPALFHAAGKAGLLVQGAWELFLLPLMAFGAGRWFVKWQGLAFFLISAIALNLDYLPAVELIFWLLIFAYPMPRRAQSFAPGKVALPVRLLAGISLVVVLIYSALGTARNLLPAGSTWRVVDRLATSRFFRLFGQYPVDVFNRSDIGMGSRSFVLFQTSADGRPIRLVPVLDQDGGRMAYLRNGLAYFSHSLRWQRVPEKRAFQADGRPTEYTTALLHRLARLDACLGQEKGVHHYGALLLKRPLERREDVPVWGESRVVGRTQLRIGISAKTSLACSQAFDLGVPFFEEKRRAEETLAWVHENWPGPPAAGRRLSQIAGGARGNL